MDEWLKTELRLTLLRIRAAEAVVKKAKSQDSGVQATLAMLDHAANDIYHLLLDLNDYKEERK